MQPNQTPAAPKPGALNPQQSRIFETLIQQGTKFLTDPANSQDLVKRAMAGDPKAVTAHAVSTLLQAQYHAAGSAGIQPDMVTITAAGIVLVGIVARMLAAVQVIPEQQIPQFCAAVAKIAAAEHNAGVQGAQQQQQPVAGAQPQGAMQ